MKNKKKTSNWLDDLFFTPEEDEFTCNSCGWSGDMCDYDTGQKDIDCEGYPIGDNIFIEICPMCGQNLSF